MNCPNCEKQRLATDTICWHCGAKLPKVAMETAVFPDPDADLLAQERSKTAVIIYASLFALTILALMAMLTALGKRPLFILNGETERPAGWTAVTNQPQTFTLNLPAGWEWLDKANEAESATIDALFAGDEGMKTAVLPFLTIVPDSKLAFLAQQKEDAPFLLILQGEALAATSPRALIADVERLMDGDGGGGNGRLQQSSIIENGITGEQVDFRFGFPQQTLRCQHRYVQDGYLLIACADEGVYGRYATDLLTTLSSFQPLRN